MDDASFQLSVIYLSAFDNPAKFSLLDHLAGLQAVFLAGARAARKVDNEDNRV
jgi:tetrahydromethanopterin S-methyltransferase subunit C